MIFFVVSIAVLSSAFSAKSFAQKPSPTVKKAEFDAETCKNYDQITDEILKLEFAGVRWQGGDSPCLKQSHFKTLIAQKIKISDTRLLDPEITLPRSRSIRIISKKWIDSGGFEVRFAYIGKKDGKDFPVEDRLVYSLHYGSQRATKGCASMTEEPKHFTMREECVHD